ncbi:alpha/beta hydrolase [Reichenbachiella sp.]
MKVRNLLPCLIFLGNISIAMAQEVIPLWSKGAIPYNKPSDLVETEKEAWGTRCVFDITEPTITLYKPKSVEISNKVVLVIPGGGYGLVAMYHEGYDVAEKLSEAGITAAVLKYRLPDKRTSDTPEKVPLADTRRAIEILRDKHNIENLKIGVLGFSAGSHLATVASLWPVDKEELKPDFSVLVYGVTIPSPENYKWLEESLYYRPMTEEEKKSQDLVGLVDDTAPPTFLVHAYDDDICPVEESTAYAEKLFANGVPVEMHLFQTGGHGFGLGRKEDGTNQWMDLCIRWMNQL